jgi:hypothetical protein
VDVFDKLVGAFEVVPRYGGQLADRRISIDRLNEVIGAFLPKSEATGTGAVKGMVAFGETGLGVYATAEDGFVATLGVQLLTDATAKQRVAGLGALLALGALGLTLANDDGGELDLSDAAAVKAWLKA